MNRRSAVSTLATAALASLACPSAMTPAPFVARAAESKWSTAIPITDFASSGDRPAKEAMQAALDASFETGLPLVFPRGDWVVDEPLAIKHTDRRRRGFPHIVGAGVGATRLLARGFDGPLLTVHGGPLEQPVGTFFLYGGGIEEIEFVGDRANAAQTGLETLGWWHGTLKNCLFRQFNGHGLRVIGNTLDPNPDWTASMLRLETCTFERIGGWGFIDDNPIGAPGFIFDRCMFNLCGAGGAFVRSSGHQFLCCSFGAAGFTAENQPSAAAKGVGLRIGDASAQTINRTRVVIAEFDSNRDAHIVIDRSTSCLIEDARFIHNDRNQIGHITPPVAVELGTGLPRSMVTNLRIARPLVRIDQEGEVTGYRLAAPEKASHIVIEAESFSYNPASRGKFTRTEGFPAATEAKRLGISVGGDSG
jgi:hypothetical protein